MKFYRYESGMGEYGVYILLKIYHLIRETNCYYIVRGHEYWGKEIRVPKDHYGCKRIHHTKEAAWKSFMIRQERRIGYLETDMKIAKSCFDFASSNQHIDDQLRYIDNSDVNRLINLS